MSDIKPIENAGDLLQRINRLSSEAEWTDTELSLILSDEGIDPSSFVECIRADAKKLLSDSPYHWRNQAKALRSKLSEAFLSVQRRRTQRLSRRQVLENIETTLARMPPGLLGQVSFEHRNFEECSDDDLESMLVELEFIQNSDPSNASE
jgi:hypothetical protein